MNRRGFITGVLGLITAPAIVRATNLMAIKPLPPIAPATVFGRWQGYGGEFTVANPEIVALLEARMNDAYRVTREHLANIFFNKNSRDKISFFEEFEDA